MRSVADRNVVMRRVPVYEWYFKYFIISLLQTADIPLNYNISNINNNHLRPCGKYAYQLL
jgi:hypothetical protein